MDQVEHVVRLIRRRRDEPIEGLVLALRGIGRRDDRRGIEVVARQKCQQTANQREARAVVVHREMRDAALLVVRHRAAELFLRHVLVRDGLDDVGSGHEHVARAAHHDGEVGNRRRVDGAARAWPHHRRNLRNDPRRQGVAEKNVGVAAERQHAFLDARAPRIVQPDDRRAHLHREVHHLDDLRGVGFRERPAEDGEVLREGIDHATVDAAVAGDDAVARDDLIGHPEVEAAVCDELVDLFEGRRRRTAGRCARAPSACRPRAGAGGALHRRPARPAVRARRAWT